MNKNYHKIIRQTLRSCGVELAQKPCKKFHKGAQEHKSNEKTLTHIFINQKNVKYTIKQSKIYRESYRKKF